jgi:hypothetical protein
MQTLVIALALLVASTSLADAQTQSRFALVSASDERGEPVLGLSASDFIVENNHVRCEVIGATPADYPLALIIDTSAFASDDFPTLRHALERFVDKTAGTREIAVYTSGAPVSRAVDFTREHDVLLRGVSRLFAARTSTTHTLDAVRRAVTDLRSRQAPVTGIVVVSAGGIETTPPRVADLLPVILASHTIVHVADRRPLRLNQGVDHQGHSRAPQSGGGDVLESLARRTHGGYVRGVDATVYATGLDAIGRQLDAEVIMEYAVAADAPRDLRVGLIAAGTLSLAIGLDTPR